MDQGNDGESQLKAEDHLGQHQQLSGRGLAEIVDGEQGGNDRDQARDDPANPG